jgi:uncharacterized protein (DUF433 family)
MSHTIATHIEVRKNLEGRDRPFIEGTRVRVQDVAMLAEVQGRTADQIGEAYPHLTLSQIHAALSYYFDHRQEIQNDLKEDDEFVEQFRRQCGAGVLERRLMMNKGQAGDAVSP